MRILLKFLFIIRIYYLIFYLDSYLFFFLKIIIFAVRRKEVHLQNVYKYNIHTYSIINLHKLYTYEYKCMRNVIMYTFLYYYNKYLLKRVNV